MDVLTSRWRRRASTAGPGRRIVAGIGRTMISAGVVILLFVAYQLWGTGLAEARSQRTLTREFERLLEEPVPTTATTATTAATPTPSPTPPPTGTPAPPPAPAGQAVAIIKIPKLNLEKAVVEGVGVPHLKKGPGHYPFSPLPGQPGNAAIAGHRTTYGAPFFRLDELKPGDAILVTTRQGRFRYEVTRTMVVRPSQTEVLKPTDDNRLTLTTCEPRFSASRRLVVISTLAGEAADPPPATTTTTTTAPATPTTTVPGQATVPTTAPRVSFEDDEAGLSGDTSARGPAVSWGLLAALIWLVTWLASRLWRRWPAYLLGAPVFLVVLFVFFENFSRLLPANY